MSGQRLTPKQVRFVQEFLADMNATQAAFRAGYSRKTAYSIASENLRKPEIIQALQEAQRRLADHFQVTQERIIQELATIGFSDVTHYGLDDVLHLQPTAQAPQAAMRAIASIKHRVRTIRREEETETVHEVEFRLWDKNTALANLGKHLGLWRDKSPDDVPTLKIILERLYESEANSPAAPVQRTQLPTAAPASPDNGHEAGGVGGASKIW
jgi:phage terminase small subunit